MRWLLMACGPMNLCAALVYAPPITQFREASGMPDAHPLYLWIMACWVPIFGIAYFWMGWTGRADRTFMAVGSAGKATFSLALIGLWLTGELPGRAALTGLPDLGLAVVFAWWLVTHRLRSTIPDPCRASHGTALDA
jgi:hypothetical protein